MHNMKERLSVLTMFVASLVVLALAGCSVQYVSRYDAETERSITGIQRQVEMLLETIRSSIGTPEAEYENFVDAYRQLSVDAAMLSTRAQAIDLNSITVEQTELLIGWLDNLEALHKEGLDEPEVLDVLRQQAELIFVAMLRFELAKKREFDSPATNGEK